MTYAKLINNELQFAPNPILVNGNWMGNPPGSVYEAEGYKPVVYTDPPTVEDGYVAVPGWEEETERIVQIWTIEPEGDISGEEAFNILIGYDV